ncbi:cytochrome P450 716B1-like [Tripterygium wilfordii]|uniref:cytochrome P450 716B1-like n=1 Tax=Tripterygium wilfordii TaxID=458696 RepID=UPI0018F81FF6|nr:cytochrome P450 716B1-like [Tripterygium wilfordii]
MNNLFAVFLFLLPIFILLIRERRWSKRLPPGSLGLPIVGQSLRLLRAMKANAGEKWFEEKIKKYGPVLKLNLFGKPTIFIYGQAANKFIFSSDGSTTVYQQTKSTSMIFGERSLFGLTGQDHKRVRQALLSFLRPESLKEYVGKMDEEVNKHFEMHWQGKQELTVMPLMKTLTFNIICSLLVGLERGTQRDEHVQSFQEMMGGVWSVPINLPFTRYNRSLRATARVRTMLKDLISQKKQKGGSGSPRQDLITYLLNIGHDSNEQEITEEEIIHNAVLVMIAGHDTTSILLTFLIQVLANNPTIYARVLQGIHIIQPRGDSPIGDLTVRHSVCVGMSGVRNLLDIFLVVFASWACLAGDVYAHGF